MRCGKWYEQGRVEKNMRYLLDTSTLVDYLREKQSVYDFFSQHESDQFVTSAICAFELFHGVFRLRLKDQRSHQDKVVALLQSLYDIISFSSKEAEIAGQIQAKLATSGTLIEDIDVLIAATAISSNATLITGNLKHFSRIPGLELLTVT